MIPHCPTCNRIAFVKTHTIEQVNNGWIVRPFIASPTWACVGEDRAEMWVYTSLDELMVGLRNLLEADSGQISAEEAKQQSTVPLPAGLSDCLRHATQYRETTTSS